MKSIRFLILAFLFLLAAYFPAHAQFKDEPTDESAKGGATLGESLKEYWESGMEITAGGGECKNIRAVIPVPTNWKEQKVKVVKEEVSSYAKISFKDVAGGGKMMWVTIARLPNQEKAVVKLRYEVECFATEAPEDTTGYKKADIAKHPKVKLYLQPSPKIESKDKKIVEVAKTIGKDAGNAWEEVEAIYDWVRAEIKYEKCPLKGALAAFKDKTGDCEEMSSLFIAICRARGIPARVVWVPGHCYAEFYLADRAGVGHWFPCQTAGDRAFGEMPFQYIILQKGDSFESPLEKSGLKRYLPVEMKGDYMAGKPKVKFTTEKVGAEN